MYESVSVFFNKVKMGSLKIYFLIFLLIAYVAVKETYAVPTAEYFKCMDKLNDTFGFYRSHKTVDKLYGFAYFNLTTTNPEDIYGKNYYGYLYLRVTINENVDSPAKYCERFDNEEELKCSVSLRRSGFIQNISHAAFRFAYRTPRKVSQYRKIVEYASMYMNYLYNETHIQPGTQDPHQWCNDEGYLKTSTLETETCINSLRISFNFPTNYKTVEELYHFAFFNLTLEYPTDLYGQYYYGYLYQQIKNKRSMFTPRRFCDQFMGESLKCRKKLDAAGLNHFHGDGAFKFVYTSSKKHEYLADENGYPYKYLHYLYMYGESSLAPDTVNAQYWCDAGGYNKDSEIKIIEAGSSSTGSRRRKET